MKSDDSNSGSPADGSKRSVSTDTACPCCGDVQPCPEFSAHHSVSVTSERQAKSSKRADVCPEDTASVHSVTTDSAERLLALRLSKLKKATLAAIRKRENLPHVLFWSLFHSEVSQIRERRQRERDQLRAQLYPYAADEPES